MDSSITLQQESVSTSQRRPQKRLPAEAGLWVFVIGDMLVFGLFFVVYLYYRSLDPTVYIASQQTLNTNLGAINTLFLLTSSWCVISAVDAWRERRPDLSARMFAMGIICGLAFCVVKYFEYSEKLSAGISLLTNEFYMFYFVLTGIHLLHVVVGLALLTYLFFRVRSENDVQSVKIRTLESGGAYWHMVDLLWVVLFPLIYLV